jgi:alkanesulfonate monooxygenase SsuD/methylene tetrahydromethanopterin reductase-like flavin-dependent oxidoreductase (luciferase family)
MIKPWAFHYNNIQSRKSPDYEDQHTVQRTFNSHLSLLASLEGLGFEGVFFSEHHFLNSLSPCPNLLVAAVAKLTKKLKLGVMGNVLPLHQPWRLAEELAMLDYLTEGRLEIGVASGVPSEMLFANIPQDDVRPMFAEMLDFLDRAYERNRVTHQGKFWNYDDLPLLPRPRTEGRRRKWMTVLSESSCRAAARRAYKICTGFQSIQAVTKAFDSYRDEADKIGLEVGPDDIGIRRQVLIWDTDSSAAALNAELLIGAQARIVETFARVRERMMKAGVNVSIGIQKTGIVDAAAPKRPETPSAPRSPLADIVSMEDEYIHGSPATVADKIIDQCRRLGAGNILAYHSPTLEDHELAHHYELWAGVVPILRKAGMAEQAL